MIVYLSPHHRGEIHSGGVEKLFDHVDILLDHGFDARVAVGRLDAEPDDLLVIPEIYGDLIGRLPGIAKVSFNQNAHNTWLNVAGPHPYRDNPDLLAVLCVSEHNREMLRYAFPDVRVERLPLSIPSRFTCGAFPRARQICYFGRKRANHAALVTHLLADRLDGWVFKALDGLSDNMVAHQLQYSAIFLSFSELEGSPAPPREAMASGCQVIGYAAGADYEFKRHMKVIAEDDVLRFAQVVAHEATFRPFHVEERGRADSDWVRREYSREAEVEAVVGFFSSVRATAGV